MEELAMHILDIVFNSIKAHATKINIYIKDSIKDNLIKIVIEDNGDGIRKDLIKKITDPFYTTRKTRKVGLGTSLFKQMALDANGSFKIESELNEGTKVTATFEKDNYDTPMMGDLAETMICLINASLDIDYELIYKDDEHEFKFDTKEFKEILEDVPLNEPSVLVYIKDYIKKGIKNEID